MIKTILIATDGSDYSKTAVEYGIYFAEKLEASLIGLHVTDIRLLPGPFFGDVTGTISPPPYQDAIPIMEAALQDRADAILKAFQEQCGSKAVCRAIRKVTGIIDETIIEEGENADCILLAQRGERSHRVGGAILGSTAESVVRLSGKPVLITPATFIETESIALAYDGSPTADHALQLAVALSDKALWPLTVITISSDPKATDQTIKKIEPLLEGLAIKAETIVLTGKEDKVLLQFIQEGSVEMMIMGAFGHNRLHELFLGSTTSSIIRKSPIPILMTR